MEDRRRIAVLRPLEAAAADRLGADLLVLLTELAAADRLVGKTPDEALRHVVPIAHCQLHDIRSFSLSNARMSFLYSFIL